MLHVHVVTINIIRKLLKTHLQKAFGLRSGQFPESPETPEIMEKMENFIKVTKYLTKQKETLINYVWEKYQFEKH